MPGPLSTTFHQLIFDTQQLTQFIGRTPKFKARDEAPVVFSDRVVWVTLPQTFDGVLELAVSSVSGNSLSVSFTHDSLPVIPLPFLTGKESISNDW
jgi:hypothetical protein